jgi:2-dehydropantoate 2-reductase
MKIVVVGAGGVGGAFGLALAKAGADVTFIARGAHLAAMKKDGLRIEGGRGESHLFPVQATDDPSSVGPADVMLYCVKLWDLEKSAHEVKSIVGPNTAVIPLQNGVDAAERLAPIFGRDNVLGGVAQISASITSPGVLTQVGTAMRIVFGEFDKTTSERGERFLALCQKAGFDAVLSADIRKDLWMKFIMLASNASVMSAARQPLGPLRDDPDMVAVFTAAYEEVIAVGRASGVNLPPDAIEPVLTFMRTAPYEIKPSMLLDLERGNRMELPWLGGKVVELGRKFAIPTPTHAMLYALLKGHVMGRTA